MTLFIAQPAYINTTETLSKLRIGTEKRRSLESDMQIGLHEILRVHDEPYLFRLLAH
jgi:hypothetical protein